jgi:hypothetical protein
MSLSVKVSGKVNFDNVNMTLMACLHLGNTFDG